LAIGTVKQPARVALICACMVQSAELLDQARALLADKFGPLDLIGPSFPFSHSNYYDDEMGPNLLKQFVSFKNLIDMDALPSIKLATNQIEESLGKISDGKLRRVINLDPGYVAQPKLVLATTKNYDHRIYLGQGIYAEVTLRFRGKTFEPLEWTYPDFKEKTAIEFFNKVREQYRAQLQSDVKA
jgi:hypothetical protein